MKLNNNLLNIKNTHSTSETDVYSANYVNTELNKKQDNGVVLYSDSTGTTEDITLSDNISNYSYLELVTKNTDGATETFGNYKFDISFSIFTLMGNSITSNSFAIFTKSYTKGTNKLTTSIGKLYSGGNVTNYDVFKITKVIGYK